jgi:hypothetical protein
MINFRFVIQKTFEKDLDPKMIQLMGITVSLAFPAG